MKRLLFLAVPALLGLATALAAGSEPKLATLRPEALPVAEDTPRWPGPQFVQADKEGRVYVLRADTLELFQIIPSGKLASRGVLEAAGADPGEKTVVRQAAMSPGGDAWALLEASNRVRIFRSGEEKPLPQTSWMVTALALQGDDPVAAVIPAQRSGSPEMARVDADHPPAKPPFLLQTGKTKWETLVEGEFFELGSAEAGVGQQVRAGTEVWLATNAKREIWVAYRNAYRLQRYSPLGRLKDEIVVGEGKVEWVQRSDEDWKRLEDLARKNKFPFRRTQLAPVQGKAVVRAMTLGRDDRAYLLVEAPEGLALDRFDPNPANLGVERILLAGLDSGRLTLAAGRHALFLASAQGDGGRWSLDWAVLDAAKWQPVAKAQVNGEPLQTEEPPAPPAKPATPGRSGGRL